MMPIHPTLETEELIYTYTFPQNGAGPLWSAGNTSIVRYGEEVFAVGVETLNDLEPLNNIRWALFRRGVNGWELQQTDDNGRQREPCLLGTYSDGRLLVSTNPTLTPPNTYDGPSNPHLLMFDGSNLAAPPQILQPEWQFNPGFNEHSYRGMGVDGPNNELVLFNNYGYDQQHWSFLNRKGQWANCGVIRYPIRGCYENVALINGRCHVMAVGDVVEPNEEWAAWKKQRNLGRNWDYVFRRLFYVWNSDIATQQFCPPVEIENVETTAGYVRNLDLWIDGKEAAHLLYFKQRIAVPEMRDVFFPTVPLETSLEYCIVQKNEVILRKTLLSFGEAVSTELLQSARLHASPDGRLFVFFASKTKNESVQHENSVFEILPQGEISAPLKIELEKPFITFQTANERGGSARSNYLDIYGSIDTDFQEDRQYEIRYARIRFE